ncbi:golgin subfamily A member Golgin-245 [Leptinotarsa decemlineata]|uniref:golgin subfamily A member Golgin-245 n=1 Tax=Leptinotarsa decemlineata TaxID=7539 RepID=UPI003D30A6BC
MFKKLKEKITEEVKISPQRFAEFTQSVSDRLQPTTSSEDSFFSIGEDDANTSATSTSNNDHGFSSVTLVSPSQETRYRKNSTSSVASDVSFLPRYEAGSMYHLQSDLDVSASELEDNVSTNSTIGHLSKEQIYSAFQKSQMRYHKYRGRFTDLSRHYKDLERENAKMKSVLVETQDKAIRRVSELKEQCSLEQKAKAHLESSLRDELDEKNYKIKALETKIELLGRESGNNSLIDFDPQKTNNQEDMENLNKYLNDARKEIEALNAKLQETKANAIIFQTKEMEYKSRISNLEKEIAQTLEREKENNLKIAETKMELHNELSSKEAAIDTLKKENESLKQSLDTFETERKTNVNVKLENLQSQNKKLIEKVENLTQKSNNLENELLRVEAYKLEIKDLKENEAVLEKEITQLRLSEEKLTKERKEFENQIMSLREDAKKGLLSLEPKIRERVQNEYLAKEEQLKEEFAVKVQELSSTNSSVKQIQLQLLEKDDLLKKTTAELHTVKSELSNIIEDYKNLEKNHLELIEECTKLRNTISSLEKEKTALDAHEEKSSRLEAHIGTLQKDLEESEEKTKQKERENIVLCQQNFDLQQTLSRTNEKLRILEVKDEAIDLDSSESKLLELKLQQLEEEQSSLLSEFETERKMFNDLLGDHRDLKKRELEIETLKEALEASQEELERLKANLESELERSVKINDEKLNYERQVEKLKEKVRIFEEKDEAINLDRTECGILELKLQKAEEDNRRLSLSFESERKSLANDLDEIRKDLKFEGEEVGEEDLKHKLNDVRRLSESKDKENVELSKEVLQLRQQNAVLTEQTRLLEEKLETVEMESTESKLLEVKVQKLEEERNTMLKEFEMERKMFEELLENHKELQQKEALISQLEENILNSRLKLEELEMNLSEEKKENVHLAEDKLVLEKRIAKLEERVRIFEEREEALELDRSECGILELKLQKLENENQNLLETFELERLAFRKTGEESIRNSHRVSELQEENSKLKELVETGKKNMERLCAEISHHNQQSEETGSKIASLLERINTMEEETRALHLTLRASEEKSKADLDQINGLTSDNIRLKRDVEEKDKQISELSKNIENLSQVIEKQTEEFNRLLLRTQQLDTALEQMRTDNSEAIQKEKEQQSNLELKTEQLQKELEEKTAELEDLNEKLIELEKLYSEEKKNYQEKTAEAEGLRERVVELMASCENVAQDKQEKESLEKRLKGVESDLKDKTTQLKVKEQENYILQEERDSLLAEIDSLRMNLTDLGKENGSLKSQLGSMSSSNVKLGQLELENDVLKAGAAKSCEEISQLNVRLQQILSDNQNVVEENQNLMHENEELKIKLEYLESEKGEFDAARAKFEEEIKSLSGGLVETKQQVEMLQQQQQNVQLGKEKPANTNGPDVAKIQRDYFEIKSTCDELYVENGNLKAEYSKLEEKCSSFGKIKQKLEAQIAELESQYGELQHEKQLLQDEVQELKTSPLNCQSDSSRLDRLEIVKKERAVHDEVPAHEIEILRDKLTKYKSLDLTNKSSIEFYENELRKMKNQNEKLNRKLDETLVTLHHCADLSSSTEVEYLRNVLYNYMLGKESLVLARVIAAVCKFDAQQTETVLQKEQQKQTLLGHLGLI